MLKYDFPRIPVTSNNNLFWEIAKLGTKLRELHIKGIDVAATGSFVSDGNPIIEKVTYDSNEQNLYINKTCYFTGVTNEIYTFTIGGYQICNKYLKDRKGRKLSKDEISHYINTIDVIDATMATMQEIDATIERHGGFPIK